MIELLPPSLPAKDFIKCPQCSYHIPSAKIHTQFHCPECHTLLSSNKFHSRIISLLVGCISFLLLCSIVLVDQAYYHTVSSSSYYLVTALFSGIIAFYIAHFLFLLLFKVKTAP